MMNTIHEVNRCSENQSVVILAAGNIKEKFWFGKYIYSSPGLIPVNCKSVLANIVEFYTEMNIYCYICINKDDIHFVKNELTYYNEYITYILIENTKGVVDSLKQSLLYIKYSKTIIVNIVTTIPTKLANIGEFFVDEQLKTVIGWSAVNKKENNIEFIYKTDNIKKKAHAFEGIFHVKFNIVENVLNSYHKDMKDLLGVVEEIHKINPLTPVPCQWLDCGHEIQYYDTKVNLVSSRSFNKIYINQEQGIIIKRSSNVEKFQDEVRYVTMLPKDISIYFPRYLDFKYVNASDASATMEFYGYPTLAEYMLYWQLGEYHWERIYNALYKILINFKQHKYSIGKQAFIEFYYERTCSRIKKFISQQNKVDGKIYYNDVLINGTLCRPISLLFQDIRKIIENIYNENDFCIMHGDFCFNNILYDLSTGIIRLIDARGSFGDNCKGIYGDIKYDVAKLAHSALGLYDCIVNNLFSISVSHNNINYLISSRDNARMHREKIFEIIDRIGLNRKHVVFLMSLIFMSIAPLHNDDYKRQNIFFFHGLLLLNNILNEGDL